MIRVTVFIREKDAHLGSQTTPERMVAIEPPDILNSINE